MKDGYLPLKAGSRRAGAREAEVDAVGPATRALRRAAPRSPAFPGGDVARPRCWSTAPPRVLVRAGGFAVISGLVGILVFLRRRDRAAVPRRERVGAARARGRDGGDRGSSRRAARSRTWRASRTTDTSRVSRRERRRRRELEAAFAGEIVARGRALPASRRSRRSARDGVVARAAARLARRRTATTGARTSRAQLGSAGRARARAGRRARSCAFSARARAERGRRPPRCSRDGTLEVVRRTIRVNDFSGERDEQSARCSAPAPEGCHSSRSTPTSASSTARARAARCTRGSSRRRRARAATVADAGAPISALSLLVGGRSVVVGQRDGSLSVWFRVRSRPRARGARARARVRLAGRRDPRDRAVVARAHVRGARPTTARSACTTRPRSARCGAARRARRCAARSRCSRRAATRCSSRRAPGVSAFAVRNPHPEIVASRRLFGPIWYEDYPEPTFVWQSTGGTEEFEPKLSLDAARARHAEGHVLRAVLRDPARHARRALHLAGHGSAPAALGEAERRDHGVTAQCRARLPGRAVAGAAARALLPGLLLAAGRGRPLLALAAGAAFRALPARLRGRLPPGTRGRAGRGGARARRRASRSRSRASSSGVLFGGDFSRLAARRAPASPTTSATRSSRASRWPSR